MLQNNFNKILAAVLMVSPICGCSIDSLKDATSLASSSQTNAEKSTVDVEALSITGAKLVASYAVAMAGVTEAQSDLANAFNLGDLAKELETQKTALKSGNLTSDDTEKVVELSEKANKAIEEKMKEQTNLDSEAKKKVGSAIVKYSVGTAGTAMLINTAKNVVTDTGSYVSSLPWTQRASALTGDMTIALNVAKEIPSLSKNLITTGNSFVEYATAQGIDVKKAKSEMSKAAGF